MRVVEREERERKKEGIDMRYENLVVVVSVVVVTLSHHREI